jgi:hypothetical protein
MKKLLEGIKEKNLWAQGNERTARVL